MGHKEAGRAGLEGELGSRGEMPCPSPLTQLIY